MRRLAVGFALVTCVTACDPSALPWAAQADAGEDARANLPPADVQLPPVPNLDLVDVPATYDDGSYSVSGLMLKRAEMRGMPTRVTGILHSIYACEEGERGIEGEVAELADPGTEQDEFEVRPGCLRPHMLFVDNLRSRQRLLVTGYDASVYEPQMTPGRRYVVHGTYDQQTRGFISTEDGLIVTTLIEGDDIVMPVEEEAP